MDYRSNGRKTVIQKEKEPKFNIHKIKARELNDSRLVFGSHDKIAFRLDTTGHQTECQS